MTQSWQDETATANAISIWHAGLEAVLSDRVVRDNIRVDGDDLSIVDEHLKLTPKRRICVVGAGKAGSGMARGVEEALQPLQLGLDRFFGWVNVPEGTEEPLPHIHLHPARPQGVNEPTPAAVAGTRRIIQLVESLTNDDVCLCLLSGGGSALLPLPTPDISLQQKIQLTRDLSAAGATIQQLNRVRRYYSQIKGGGLARRCRAGLLICLIISDVLGDPLDVIASGPTVMDETEYPLDSVIERLREMEAMNSLQMVQQVLARPRREPSIATCRVVNRIIANNETAVQAAAFGASQRKFSCEILPPEPPDTTADELGIQLADWLTTCLSTQQPRCLVSGGEPIVRLAHAEQRGKGGRNQQLVLAALCRLLERVQGIATSKELLSDFALLSAGTDGEDGPTDAAGAYCNREVLRATLEKRVDAPDFLRRNDAYHFFALVNGLFVTGPTRTNVCDLRIITVQPNRSTDRGHSLK